MHAGMGNTLTPASLDSTLQELRDMNQDLNHKVDMPRDCDAEFIALMKRAEIADCELVPWGSNYTFAVLLEDPSGEETAIAIYKPAAGEVPLWDFPDDTLYRREYAAYLVSEAIGWKFVPETIIREGPHGVGSLQRYVEPEPGSHYFSFRDEHIDDLKRIALFDVITNNADRKATHCIRGADDRCIWGIDHGLTFNVEPKLRTVIWDFQLEPIERPLRDDLESLSEDRELASRLRELLTQREVDTFRLRAKRLARAGVFPPLQSRRNIPWGW